MNDWIITKQSLKVSEDEGVKVAQNSFLFFRDF